MDKLKNILSLCKDDTNSTSDLATEVTSYINHSHPMDDDFYFQMWPAIAQVTATVTFGEPNLKIEDYSDLSELAKGIIDAVYAKAMHDCAKAFNIKNGDIFHFVISDCNDNGTTIDCPELNAMAKEFE